MSAAGQAPFPATACPGRVWPVPPCAAGVPDRLETASRGDEAPGLAEDVDDDPGDADTGTLVADGAEVAVPVPPGCPPAGCPGAVLPYSAAGT